MILNRRQFDVLSYLEFKKADGKQTQRSIAEEIGLSTGSANKTLTELKNEGFVDNGIINEAGLIALEPYRVKRAIFLAAGFGARLLPISLNTPKSLIRVNGVRIIDTMIDALLAVGIDEIIIVRGYLGEQFEQLLIKYPMIKFVENPYHNETNNISSMMQVLSLLKNAYVFDADFLLYNPSVIKKYHYASNYLAFHVDRTDDWCIEVNNGYISKLKLGGHDCYQMMSFAYWNEIDGAKLPEHIRTIYESPAGKEWFWDQVPLDFYAKEYKIYIRECSPDDIVEIDNYSDLKKLDSNYT